MKSQKSNISEDDNYVVTLVLKSVAKKGYDFYHENEYDDCKSCKLYQICMKNLQKHRTYKVVDVRNSVVHKCPNDYFKEDLVVVRVKECPIEVAFPIRKVFENIQIKYHPIPCPEKSCKYFENCNPPNKILVKGMPVVCLKIIKKIKDECKYKKDLGIILVKRRV
ncbi:MAG: UPF0179 family protein [Promethearchaeota archaeon]